MTIDPKADLLARIRAKCQQERWYGPWDFRRYRKASPSTTSGFAFEPASVVQLQQTEAIIQFPLPSLLRALYAELANGGFGSGGGLRGAVGGYGTIGTPVLNGRAFLNDETLLKYHLGQARLVDLARYADRWQQEGRTRWVNLPADAWPQQLIPVCDLGDIQEVCLDCEGHLFFWGSSEQDDLYTLSSQGITFEQWLLQWLEN